MAVIQSLQTRGQQRLASALGGIWQTDHVVGAEVFT